MATLWIREYVASGLGTGLLGNGYLPIAAEPGTDQTPVTFTTSTRSEASAAATRFIAVISDADCHYVVGSNPTATTNALFVPANTLLYLGVTPGQKIAAIAAA